MLIQRSKSGTAGVLNYVSRILNEAERKYSITEKECLAVVHCILKLNTYLLGKEFVVVTDHIALQWLMSCNSKNLRLTHWALTLQSYSFKIKYRSGRSNKDADHLSRYPSADGSGTTTEIDSEPPGLIFSIEEINMKVLQSQDAHCIKINKLINDQKSPISVRNYTIVEDLLCKAVTVNKERKIVPVLPKSLVP